MADDTTTQAPQEVAAERGTTRRQVLHRAATGAVVFAYARAAAEVAAQSGHDLFWFLAPPAQYEDQVVNHADVVQEVTKKRGKMADVCYRSTYNPRTKKYFAFADTYAPDPVNWRTDLWGELGLRPNTWESVLRAAPALREKGNPIGIGMSNEIDSNMALMSLMMC